MEPPMPHRPDIRVEDEAQVIRLEPRAPVDLSILARSGMEWDHGFDPVEVRVSFDVDGRVTTWTAQAEHIPTGEPRPGYGPGRRGRSPRQ